MTGTAVEFFLLLLWPNLQRALLTSRDAWLWSENGIRALPCGALVSEVTQYIQFHIHPFSC